MAKASELGAPDRQENGSAANPKVAEKGAVLTKTIAMRS